MAHGNEEYIYELTKNLDWNIKIRRCSDYADGGCIYRTHL